MPPTPPTSPQPPPPIAPAAGPQNAESGSMTAHRESVRSGEAGQVSSVASRRGVAGAPDDRLVLTRAELEELTAEELHDLASALELEGRSSMNKSELVDALTAQD